MTYAHILYIPTIFMLGLLTGMLLQSQSKASNESNALPTSSVPDRMLLGSFVIFIFAFIGTHFFHIPKSAHAVTLALNGAEIFDKKPSYSSEEFYRRIASFPQTGIELYKQFTYTMDVLFPLTLLAFLTLLLKYTCERASIPARFQKALIITPVAWFFLDMLENLMVFNLLNTFPIRNHFLAGLLGYITIGKFTFLFFSIAAPTIIKLFETKLSQKFGRGK